MGRKKRMISFIWKLLMLEVGLCTAAWRCPVASGYPRLGWRHRSGGCQQVGVTDVPDQTEGIREGRVKLLTLETEAVSTVEPDRGPLEKQQGHSLQAQRLGLCRLTAEGPGSIPS